jgi:hypothetical protein
MDLTASRHRASRLAVGISILAALLVLVSAGTAAAEEREAPLITAAFGNDSGAITLAWFHRGPGVYGYAIQLQQGEEWLDAKQLDHTFGQYTLGGLAPETWYTLRVCAVYGPADDDRECSEPAVRVRTQAPQPPPAGGGNAALVPPADIRLSATTDMVGVSWGATGRYEYILVRLTDTLGNKDQRDIVNHANGHVEFEGMRPGAQYNVQLKACDENTFGQKGCGDWSKFYTVTTDPLHPPSTPRITVASYTQTSVTLAFSVEFAVEALNPGVQFEVYRDSTRIATVQPAPTGTPGHWTGTYPDPIGSRHEYGVCFVYGTGSTCSETPVARPKFPSELTVSEVEARASKPFVPRPQPLSDQVVSETKPARCVVGLPGCNQASPVLHHGPDTCESGYVWREAFEGDTVCVTEDRRTQAAMDNAAAAERRAPGGGAYGPHTCKSPYVWRVARPDDLVCVTTETRDRTAAENAQANAHRVAPR